MKVIGDNLFKEIEDVNYGGADNEHRVTVYVAGGTSVGHTDDSVRLWPRGDVMVLSASISTLRAARALSLPEGLERVGSCWFAESEIETVVVPASVVTIGSHAFDGCWRLREVAFQQGSALERIESSAFYECRSLKRIELPSL